jgi:hypothetical protein
MHGKDFPHNSNWTCLGKEPGFYMKALRNWLTYIPRNQLFIVNMESLLGNEYDTINRLLNFLGYPAHYNHSQKLLPHENAKSKHCEGCEQEGSTVALILLLDTVVYYILLCI